MGLIGQQRANDVTQKLQTNFETDSEYAEYYFNLV